MTEHLEKCLENIEKTQSEMLNLFRSFLASKGINEVECNVSVGAQFFDNLISQKVNTNLSFMATEKGVEQLP